MSRRVIVLGAGNAGLCAALAAREQGAEVTVLEAAPPAEHGGNSAFTAGAMRVVYSGADDLAGLMPDLTADDFARTDFGSYSRAAFLDDMARVTEYRCDPELTDVLVTQSMPTLRWMRGQGVRFAPSYGRQAFQVSGRFTFWGGLAVEAHGGGPGLVGALLARAGRTGVDVRHEHRGVALTQAGGRVSGVVARHGGQAVTLPADAVVLASGGFEANAEWRTRYLGPGWDLARVRGTRFNTGGGIAMALDLGAMPFGNWSGCHAVSWDRNAPLFGNRAVGDGYQKHSYPFGIMVNAAGRRFVDEGADFRNYTYAKYGREVLAQPGQFAWQVFDAKAEGLLRDEYRIREVSKVTGSTLEELAAKMGGTDPAGFLRTVREYNQAVDQSVPFSPNVKDGRRADLPVPKSNWAALLDTPPYAAYEVTCGITFTFGGLRITPGAAVVDVGGQVIPGLYACGELVGGLFYFNYPGGTGLTSGAVFGRIAGTAAGAA
jgi:tricarballylate dehydrogenase